MQNQVRIAFELLLKDNFYITSRPSITGKERYCVYDDSTNPRLIIYPASFRMLYDILIKKGKKFYLSRKAIRSLHGNNYFKKKYKLIQSGEKK